MNGEIVSSVMIWIIIIAIVLTVFCEFMDYANRKRIQNQNEFINTRKSIKYFRERVKEVK